jgi:hypothetical protein
MQGLIKLGSGDTKVRSDASKTCAVYHSPKSVKAWDNCRTKAPRLVLYPAVNREPEEVAFRQASRTVLAQRST